MSEKRTEEILIRRAEKAARVAETSDEREIITTVAVVGVGNEKLGIPLDGLVSINRAPAIAQLPRMPKEIRGIVQVRGELIGVVDIARWFGVESPREKSLLAVVEGIPGKLGLLVDSVLGFRDVREDELAETFCDDTKSTGHPVQVTTKDLIAILNLDQLLNCDEVNISFRETHAKSGPKGR
jgi:purine-binding chemotaxis protein CheW